jgi:hypothetical protein
LCTAVTLPRRAAALRPRQVACGVRDAAAGGAGDLAHRQRSVGVGHELGDAGVHVAIGVETLGRFADDHQVDRLGERRQAGAGPAGADVGAEREAAAQDARRIEATLFRRRIFVMRYRPEDHSVDPRDARKHRIGQRRAL